MISRQSPSAITITLNLAVVASSLFVGMWPALAAPAPAITRPAAEPSAFGTDEAALDQDSNEKFVPRRARTEIEQDRLEALSLFGAARMKEEKQDFAGALRLYERAFRIDPRAIQSVREIVPLAFNLGRTSEAVRYALKAANLEGTDPVFLRRLGTHLTSQGDFEQSLKLFEKALALEAQQPPDANRILLLAQMGKLYLITQHFPTAAKAYAEVMTAIAPDSKIKLDERTRRMILEDAAKINETLQGKVAGRAEDACAYDLFGSAFLEGEDYERALAAFQKANELSPSAGIDGLQRAEVLARQKKTAEALAALTEYFNAKLSVRGSAPYELLATLLTDEGKSDQLLDQLEKLRAADPDNVALRYYLANRYREGGKLEEAQPLYESALSAQPAIEGYRGLVDMYRRTGQAEPLLKLLVEILTQLRSLELLSVEVKAVCDDGPLVDQLLEVARRQQRAEPDKFDVASLTAIGTLALDADQFDAAAEFFELAVKAKPDQAAGVLRRWGLSLLVKERFDDAVRIFQRAIDQNLAGDLAPEFHYHLAGSLEMLSRTDEALAAARRAVELAQPKSTTYGDMMYRFHARAPWVLYHAKRYDAAHASYAAELARIDATYDNEEARNSAREARLMLSNLDAIQHRVPEAVEWLEQILDEFPDNVSALNDLGYLWADQGKHRERALAMIDTALAEDPKNGAYLDSRGWALYRLGRFDEAVAALRQAVDVDPDPDGVILDHLADAYLAAGDRGQALATWQRAIAAFEKAGEKTKQAATQTKIDRENAAGATPGKPAGDEKTADGNPPPN